MSKKKEESKGARPALTPEGREQQLINLAINLAEKQLMDGTASPSVINHYLKMGSRREVIEREILAEQKEFLKAKSQSIAKGQEQEQITKDALDAFKNYSAGSR